MTEEIRPDYYKRCGIIGRQIISDFLPYEMFDTECLVPIEGLKNDFDLGNALKYLWRCGVKHDDFRPDLTKALFYLTRYAQRPTEERSSLVKALEWLEVVKPPFKKNVLGMIQRINQALEN